MKLKQAIANVHKARRPRDALRIDSQWIRLARHPDGRYSLQVLTSITVREGHYDEWVDVETAELKTDQPATK